jgi:NDP-sugar pyrophosphorylase family protein
MKAFILAAGLGTRLKPWTLSHPKALVPINGTPMLELVVKNLIRQGFNDITINIHHFGEQIIEFLESQNFNAKIAINDERGKLLDTGGALVGAMPHTCCDDAPILVHNVDILSNADLAGFYTSHIDGDADASLLVSDRNSTRRLLFDYDNCLRGWTNLITGEVKPSSLSAQETTQLIRMAFSGIYIVTPRLCSAMERTYRGTPFPIMDFLLSTCGDRHYKGITTQNLEVLDIGKPETLRNAAAFMERLNTITGF